ncbi:ribosomal protein S5 domain 2-like protein [Flagelloscypha sp. PMI_526]|nr:ribosomal protein S5 domain 2-like protein [Flagelloscypha sp. PMI_526]
MPRPISPSLPEKTFVISAIQSSLRLDGRALLELRTPDVDFFDHVLGKVEVAMGETRVLAHVTGKMVKPPPERPFEGILSIHAEISPMAGWEDYEAGRPSEEEVTLNRMLDKILRRSDALDKESLCVLAGQRVWHVTLTIHPLVDAGNVVDVSVLAGILALKHWRRPEVEVVGEEIIVHPASERAPLPLSMNHTPYCFTFVLFPPAKVPDIGEDDMEPVPVLDPTTLESKLSNGKIVIALNAQRELMVVQKSGGLPLSEEQTLNIIDVAVERAKDMDSLVNRVMKEDWDTRVVEFR